MQERTGQEEGEHEGRQAWLMVGEARVKGKGPLQVWQQWRREWMWEWSDGGSRRGGGGPNQKILKLKVEPQPKLLPAATHTTSFTSAPESCPITTPTLKTNNISHASDDFALFWFPRKPKHVENYSFTMFCEISQMWTRCESQTSRSFDPSRTSTTPRIEFFTRLGTQWRNSWASCLQLKVLRNWILSNT